MNKRLEEKLAMLAFGDMSPEEITHLEIEVAGDREASLVLEQYRGMRSGLRAMGDVPQHQLSTERLRHAILTQGLKPKARPQFGWLWMPAMAAALAFGIVFIRNASNSVLPGGSPSDPMVMSMDKSGSSIKDEQGANVFALATASGEILSVGTKPAPKMRLASNESRSGRRHRADVEALKQAIMAEFDSNQMMVNTGTNTFAETSKPAPQSDSIVLIDTARDSTTGAQKATEVDSASVVVGG